MDLVDPDPYSEHCLKAVSGMKSPCDKIQVFGAKLDLRISTVIARISDIARISVTFGSFCVLKHNFEMRHYFNDVKVPKNSQDQCEFEYLFIF